MAWNLLLMKKLENQILYLQIISMYLTASLCGSVVMCMKRLSCHTKFMVLSVTKFYILIIFFLPGVLLKNDKFKLRVNII